MTEDEYNKFKPSEKALGSFLLACKIKGIDIDSKELNKYFPHDESKVLIVQKEIMFVVQRAKYSNLKGVMKKFITNDNLEKRFKKKFINLTEREIKEAYIKKKIHEKKKRESKAIEEK